MCIRDSANIEHAQAARGDVTRGIDPIVESIAASAKHYLNNNGLRAWLTTERCNYSAEFLLHALLEQWSTEAAKPSVLFLDEIDALVGDTLISVLRQIRAGYAQRPEGFPISIVLCGVRDVRDYRMKSQHQEVITGGSAFNIKAVSLRLGNFNEAEVRALWAQHTTATGQIFAEAIYPELWADTQGPVSYTHLTLPTTPYV